ASQRHAILDVKVRLENAHPRQALEVRWRVWCAVLLEQRRGRYEGALNFSRLANCHRAVGQTPHEDSTIKSLFDEFAWPVGQVQFRRHLGVEPPKFRQE